MVKRCYFAKRTYRSSANTGLSIFERVKTNWFLSANERKSTPKRGQKAAFCGVSNRNLRIERRQRAGEYKGGYTSFGLDVSRHEESAGRRAALWGRRAEPPIVKKG